MHASSISPTISGTSARKSPLRGALVIGAATTDELAERLAATQKAAAAGEAPAPVAPDNADLRATERVAIDYADASELAAKSAAAPDGRLGEA